MRIMHMCAILFALLPVCAAFPAYADPNPKAATEKPPPLPERNPRFLWQYAAAILKCDSPAQLTQLLRIEPEHWAEAANAINTEAGSPSCMVIQDYLVRMVGPVIENGKPLYVVKDDVVFAMIHCQVGGWVEYVFETAPGSISLHARFQYFDAPVDIYTAKVRYLPEAMRLSPEL